MAYNYYYVPGRIALSDLLDGMPDSVRGNTRKAEHFVVAPMQFTTCLIALQNIWMIAQSSSDERIRRGSSWCSW